MPRKRGDAPDSLVSKWYLEVPEGEAAYEVEDSAYSGMLHLGIKLPERPSVDSEFLDEDRVPVMPANVMDLNDRDIGELYSIVQSYHSYVNGQLGRIDTRVKQAEKQVNFIAARVRTGKQGTAKDKDDRKHTDVRYVTADARALELRCLYTLVSKVVEGIEGDLRLISRAISLREQAIKTGTRTAAIDARKRFSSPRPAQQGRGSFRKREAVPKVKVRKKAVKSILPPRRRVS